MLDSNKIVATEVIRNLGSTAEVSEAPLGSHWYEVHVNVLMESN